MKNIHSKQLEQFDCSHKKDTFCPILNNKELIPVKCIDVYDGDTMKIAFHLFNNQDLPIVVFSCRLDGIDTPEMKGTKGSEKELAIKARDYIRQKCLNKCVYAHILSEIHEKYGRLMIWIYSEYTENPTFENSLNHELIELGMAHGYDGGTKTDFDL